MPRDHPRRCGENLNLSGFPNSLRGSPPQVRGKHMKSEKTKTEERITPAGAGKTIRRSEILPTPRDHPRRCGENALEIVLYLAHAGITPAGAGKTSKEELLQSLKRDHPRRCGENVSVIGYGPLRFRITPAGAGKTFRENLRTRAPQDHPRRCGENSTTCDKLTFPAGSPPQVRGKLNL